MSIHSYINHLVLLIIGLIYGGKVMEAMAVFLQEMFILYGIALLGWTARKLGILNEHANDVLTPLILYITLPALILFSSDLSFSFTLLKEFV